MFQSVYQNYTSDARAVGWSDELAMSHKSKGHAKLEARLGYKFADPELLDRALTHSSAIAPAKRIEQSYQRLEFLGDRVLGLVVADLLYRRFPKATEGDSRARSTRSSARRPAP